MANVTMPIALLPNDHDHAVAAAKTSVTTVAIKVSYRNGRYLGFALDLLMRGPRRKGKMISFNMVFLRIATSGVERM
jgi:hypothetical protein